jgi:hypothetical protein
MLMGLVDPNEGTLRMMPRPGEVRNPLGINSPKSTKRNKEIRALLQVEGNKPCEIEGYEDWTQLQYTVHMLYLQAMAGDHAARKMIFDRVYGRVPFDVNMEVTHREELEQATDAELLARVDALRALLAPEGLPAATHQSGGFIPPEGDAQ